MDHEKTHQTNPMAPWDPLDALLTPWDPLATPQSTPQTHKQVSWPHCTLKITATASKTTFTITPVTPFTPIVRPLLNNHPEDPASCKRSSEESALLQLIIRRKRPLANDHLEGPATCKWSPRGTGLLQMIIWRIWPLANDLPEDPASCKGSFVTPITLSPLPGSIVNLADLSWTICSCYNTGIILWRVLIVVGNPQCS